MKKEERPPQKGIVVEELETDAETPRVRQFRLPKGQVERITYLLDKYGEDYKVRNDNILVKHEYHFLYIVYCYFTIFQHTSVWFQICCNYLWSKI